MERNNSEEVRLETLVRRKVVVQLELLPDLWPHVPALLHQGEEEWHELHQLVVWPVHEPGLDGNPVLQLIPEGLRTVVDDDSFPQVPPEDVQILDVVTIDADTMLSK